MIQQEVVIQYYINIYSKNKNKYYKLVFVPIGIQDVV
jgi:hypothetical protein